MNKKLKTNHLQVLVDDDMLKSLNRLITLQSLEDGTRPKSQSAFVRELINNEINRNEINLKFYKRDSYKKSIQNT